MLPACKKTCDVQSPSSTRLSSKSSRLRTIGSITASVFGPPIEVMIARKLTALSGTITQGKLRLIPKALLTIKHLCRVFCTWNDKFVHVWNPSTSQLLYNVDFHAETKSHCISDMTYSTKNFVSLQKLNIVGNGLFSILCSCTYWFPQISKRTFSMNA